jgi:hypothetical protein
MDLGLHIAVHARKKSFLRHTDTRGNSVRRLKGPPGIRIDRRVPAQLDE